MFAQVKPDLIKKVRALLLDYYKDYEKPAKVYTGMTCLTLLIDIISTWVYIGKVGLNDEDPSAQTVHLGQLFAVFFYFILDMFFYLWLLHFRFRLPETM